MDLSALIEIRNRVQLLKYSDRRINGYIQELTQKDIRLLSSIEESLTEIYDESKKFYTCSKLDDLIGKKLFLKIDLGFFSHYFESFSEFIEQEKYELSLSKYYINQFEISEKENQDNCLMHSYFQNLYLIRLLKDLSDHSDVTAGQLRVYFHRVGNSLVLPIEYGVPELENLMLNDIIEIREAIFGGIHKSERSKLFVNELMNIFSNKEKKYSLLIENWSMLKENYYSSFESYLEGFSFEKIKTSSLQYFQELNDKIHETIRKVSNYIFGIPIAFLFLISRLEFSEPSALKNFSLLGVGYLFILLIYKIFFRSVEESLDSIKNDIIRYENKIRHISSLSLIHTELEELKDSTLENQYKKLKILRWVTFFIAFGLTSLVFYLSCDAIMEVWNSFIIFIQFITNR